MKDQLKWVLNHMPKSDDQHLDVMSLPNVAKARSFHGSFPQYSITPLAQLDGMAKYLGLAGVYVKDESYRFGLNAFKVLGGAKVTIEEVNYDDCVRMAAAEAAQTEHGVIVQDTAWDGYEEIPSWIMQGYGTMANEAADQLRQCSVNRPTHVFVQAGVGSLAGAVVGYFANLFPNDPPKFVVMEAEAADCLYQGALANDGKPRIVTGDLKTIMAGLACGEPNTISWDILRNHVSAFISCPDWVSAKGMRMLSSPVKGDPRVVSGESGAVGMGVLDAIMCDDTYKELRDALELDRHSRVLMFSTEGNTDPEKYRRVVWDGEYPTDDTPQKPC